MGFCTMLGTATLLWILLLLVIKSSQIWSKISRGSLSGNTSLGFQKQSWNGNIITFVCNTHQVSHKWKSFSKTLIIPQFKLGGGKKHAWKGMDQSIEQETTAYFASLVDGTGKFLTVMHVLSAPHSHGISHIFSTTTLLCNNGVRTFMLRKLDLKTPQYYYCSHKRFTYPFKRQ